MEEDIFSPVSILKKTKVTEFVNINVKRERRGVVIVEEEKEVGDDSDHDSEDSALCLKEEDSSHDTSTSIPPLDHAPSPGKNHSKCMI